MVEGLVKTKQSVRTIPLHSVIIGEGFLAYVELLVGRLKSCSPVSMAIARNCSASFSTASGSIRVSTHTAISSSPISGAAMSRSMMT